MIVDNRRRSLLLSQRWSTLASSPTIEAQLTHVAELVLSGSIAEALYASVICGALATLPMPRDGTDEWLWAVQLEPESAPMEGFRVSVSGLRQWAAGGWGPVTVS